MASMRPLERFVGRSIWVKSPEITRLYNSQGAYAVANSPEQMAELINREIAMWADVVKAAGIKPQPL